MQTKNLFSAFIYLGAAGSGHISTCISYGIYVLVPALYFLPEKKLAADTD